MKVLAPTGLNVFSPSSSKLVSACSPPGPVFIVTPATPQGSPQKQDTEEMDRLFPNIPPKPRLSPQVIVTEVSPITFTAAPTIAPSDIAISTLPPTPPPTLLSSLPIPVKNSRQSQRKTNHPRNLRKFNSRTTRHAPLLRDGREVSMASNGKLGIKLYPPVYVPFQTPKPVEPGRRVGKVVWGGLRLEPNGVSTEELLSMQLTEADARAQGSTRAQRRAGANAEARASMKANTGKEASDLRTAEDTTAKEDRKGTGNGEGSEISNGVPSNCAESLPPLWRISLAPSSNNIEPPTPSAEPTQPPWPPTKEPLLTCLIQILLRKLLSVLHYLRPIYTFLTAPIRRCYDEWDARRGPLGSHNTRTGRWLRKTRVWRGFEEYRPGHGNDYGNEYGFGYGSMYGDGNVDMAEDGSDCGDERGSGGSNGRRDGYGTFSAGVPTSRESMSAKGLGTVVSWEERGRGVS